MYNVGIHKQYNKFITDRVQINLNYVNLLEVVHALHKLDFVSFLGSLELQRFLLSLCSQLLLLLLAVALHQQLGLYVLAIDHPWI